MEENRKLFGTLSDGSVAELCTLRSPNVEVDISNFGATIVAVRLPDRNGVWEDVALGYDTPQEYMDNPGCHGATVGRYAGRIANARFPLNGKIIQLEKNRGEHSIHGGPIGFHKRLWTICVQEEDRLELELFSQDGDQGFPGNMTVRVTFLLNGDTLAMIIKAVSDADTPFNMTNHIYWNLGGYDHPTVDDHIWSIPASEYLEQDAENIPSGRILSLEGTGLDWRKPTPVSEVHADYSFLLNKDGCMQTVGRIEHPASGRWLEVASDFPSVQVFTADNMVVLPGKRGTVHGPRRGMCLEAQFYPDSPNHPHFPDTILRAGEMTVHGIRWQFGVDACESK